MRASEKGISLIKEFEGFRAEAYKDSAGVLTIGFGHTMNVKPGDYIDEEEAEALLRAELIHYENAVERLVTQELTQNEFDALVSLCYNIGEGNLGKSSVVRFLNLGYKRKAADAFLLWKRAKVNGVLTVLPGLEKRRKAERQLFLTT